MPTPNAMLDYTPRSAEQLRGLQATQNRESMVVIQADPYANRIPEFYVGIFNVSKTEFRVTKPFGKGGRTDQGQSARQIILPGRKDNELYGKPFILRDIEPMVRSLGNSDELTYVPTSGELLAQDVVNTNDPRGNWRTSRPLNAEDVQAGIGTNHYEHGVFWCRLATPDAEPDLEALEFAINKLNNFYQKLVEQGNSLWFGDPKDRKFIAKPHHDAAEALEIDTPWHTRYVSPQQSLLASKKKAAAEAKKEKEIK